MEEIRNEFLLQLTNHQYSHYIDNDDNIVIGQPKNQVDDYHISLDLIKRMPDNVIFNNRGNVWLNSLTKIGKNIIFNNEGFVNLESLESLNNTVQFNNKSFISLPKVKKIPNGFTFNNKKGVYLLSLKIKDCKGIFFKRNQNIGLSDLDTREWDCSIQGVRNCDLVNIIIKRL